jgi:hypothetical protein
MTADDLRLRIGGKVTEHVQELIDRQLPGIEERGGVSGEREALPGIQVAGGIPGQFLEHARRHLPAVVAVLAGVQVDPCRSLARLARLEGEGLRLLGEE